MEQSNRRDHYRVRYPITERPRLFTENQPCEILDCSSQGLRYLLSKQAPPPIGAIVEGMVRFRRGATVSVTGVVVRVRDKEVALYFPNSGIPASILLEEQRYLHTHYPMWP